MNPVHHLSETAKQWLDAAAIGSAVVAGISLAQTALMVTILAGLISIVLGVIRIYDRFTQGRAVE